MKPQRFLPAYEERDLARRYREGDEKAGHRLARAYLPLVKRTAAQFLKKYSGSWEDLVSEGWVGLMKAVRGYDPDQGARLGTYAAKWIEAELREYTMRQTAWSRPVFSPLEALEAGRKSEAVSPMEFPKWDGRKRADFEEIDLLAEEGGDQEEALGDRQEQARRREFLKKALNSLSDPERQIIVERHLRQQATPLKDLGARFGLSGESIRQMELKALKVMKGMATARENRRGLDYGGGARL